jgi:hypothetical protein
MPIKKLTASSGFASEQPVNWPFTVGSAAEQSRPVKVPAEGEYGGSFTGRKSGTWCFADGDSLLAGIVQSTFDGVDIVDAAAPGAAAELLQKCPQTSVIRQVRVGSE